jgi:hypothetical protein
MVKPGPHVEIYTKDGDPGYFFNDFHTWHHVPELKRFAFKGPCAELAGKLIGVSRISLFDDRTFVKKSGTLTPTRWPPGSALCGSRRAVLLELDSALPGRRRALS